MQCAGGSPGLRGVGGSPCQGGSPYQGVAGPCQGVSLPGGLLAGGVSLSEGGLLAREGLLGWGYPSMH